MTLLLVVTTSAWAYGFEVRDAGTRLVRGVYFLDATIEYEFTKPPIEALNSGVPLTIIMEMEVVRRHEWMWDESVADLQQRFRLEYHALAEQYVVVNLNNGAFTSFPTLSAATGYLGGVRDFPLLDGSLVASGDQYYGRMRVSLDLEALPAPLRLVAYLTKRWRLASEWYQWPL
jgi:hypothetical protein